MTNKILVLLLLLLLPLGCDSERHFSTKKYTGLIINEVAAHDEKKNCDSWVEIVNNSQETKDLSSLGIYLFDEYFEGRLLTNFEGQSLGAGERLIVSTGDGGFNTGFASNAKFSLVLGLSSKKGIVDKFSRGELKKLPLVGSYQRIPDLSGEWQMTPAASKGKENIILSLENTKPNAIWLWSTHTNQWLENDGALMKNMKALGYDHILLNYAAFAQNSMKVTKQFLELAAETGMMLHVWMQCFYQGGRWISPVDDANNCYKQDLFDRIVADAKTYVEEYGAQGIHLDYIRFGGTAYKHNPSPEVTAVGAVVECCRQVREGVDACTDGVILSAAMMAEDNASYYYGQDAAKMGRHIDIFMPMIYRYHAGGVKYGDEWCKRMSRLFTTVTDSQVWAGITTYEYVGENVSGLSAEAIRADANVFLDTDCTGLVLFRYGLGTFPDVTTLWK